MVDLNEDEKKRQEIGLKFKNNQLNNEKEIQYFLEQFKDGQYAFSDDDLMKIAELVKKNPEKAAKVSKIRNFFTYGRRGKKAENIKKQMTKIENAEARRDFDILKAELKYKGLPRDKSLIIATINELNDDIAKGHWYKNPLLQIRRRRQKKSLNKALNKKNTTTKLEGKARATKSTIEMLENKVAGSGFFKNLGDKTKLGWQRYKYNRIQKKIIGKELINGLSVREKALQAEKSIIDAEAKAAITKTQLKRATMKRARNEQELTRIKKRVEKLNGKLDNKIQKTVASFKNKEAQSIKVILGKTAGIDEKNKKLESHSLEGKVRSMLLAKATNEEVRKNIEATINSKREIAITDDADFKKFLEKAGFEKADINILQSKIASYQNKETKSEAKSEDEMEPLSAVKEDVKVTSNTTVEEYRKIIENDAQKTAILEKSLDAEMKARCIAAALTVEDAKIKNMPMIKELRDKGANVDVLVAAREKSIREKGAALTPDRRQELRELSVASKVVKMDDTAYKAFKESDLKNASPEQVRLLDNMRLPKDSEEYNKLSPEDKGKVEKTNKDLGDLNKNKERNKILAARGLVSGKTTDGKKPSKQKVVANQRIIKENQAQRQFR